MIGTNIYLYKHCSPKPTQWLVIFKYPCIKSCRQIKQFREDKQSWEYQQWSVYAHIPQCPHVYVDIYPIDISQGQVSLLCIIDQMSSFIILCECKHLISTQLSDMWWGYENQLSSSDSAPLCAGVRGRCRTFLRSTCVQSSPVQPSLLGHVFSPA